MTQSVRVASTGLRYYPILELGAGGAGIVHLAVARGAQGFNKLVVLKSPRDELVNDPEVRSMFLEEARLSARLNHPNVVQVHEVIDGPSAPLLVMEYLEGETLSAIVRRAREAFPVSMHLKILCDALAGLHYSHELRGIDGAPLNLVHRDVSPQNVFVTYDGQVKVLDFGTAKVANAATHTRTGLVKGKLGYMPPEQLLSEKLDRRADVFAVGCMLWEASVGGRLWGKLREGEIAHRLLHGQIPRPEGGREVDPELEAIIMKALAPNKDDRYPSALALQQDLEAYLMSHHPVGSARDVSKFVSELFAEDRQERARVVNAALQDGIREAAVAESIVPAAPETVNTGVTTTKRGVRANRFAVMLVVPIALTLGAVVVTRGLGASRVAAPNATVTAAPQLVHIGIRAIPAEAKLTLDGKPLASNPARIEVPEDGVDHLVRAEAPGFRPLERIVRFSGDADIILKLESEEGEAPDAAAPIATESQGEDRPKAKTRAYVPRRPAAPATGAPAKPASPHCDPPFVFINGVKAYKPECL